MIEYFTILFIVIAGGWGASALGVSPLWALVPAAAVSLPSAWAALTTAPYVPSSRQTLNDAFDLADASPGERFVDLGCGDGRALIEARARGLEARGVELSLFLAMQARWRCGDAAGWGSLWSVDLSDADLVFCYLSHRGMERFERELWPTLKPGCRVVSHLFPMKNTPPDRSCGVLALYIRPDASLDHS